MDPASQLDAVRNIGLVDGRIAVIATHAIRGRDTVDAHGLVVAPGFIDLHAHGQTPETYRFNALDGRSEEHTSELQSRLHLVCRLLLEKKKKHHLPTRAILRKDGPPFISLLRKADTKTNIDHESSSLSESRYVVVYMYRQNRRNGNHAN